MGSLTGILLDAELHKKHQSHANIHRIYTWSLEVVFKIQPPKTYEVTKLKQSKYGLNVE